MKNSFILIFLLIPLSLFCQDVAQLNNRAYEDLYTDPSASIYYLDYALDSNFDYHNKEEYIRSLYYKSIVHNYLKQGAVSSSSIRLAHELNEKWNFVYNDPEYYRDLINSLIEEKQIEKCYGILSNTIIIKQLSQRTLVKFKFLKLKLDLMKEGNYSEEFSQLVNASKSFEYFDILSESYLIYGRKLIIDDPGTAISLFNESIDQDVSNITVEAYRSIGSIYTSWNRYYDAINVLRRGYLIAQEVGSLEVIDPIASDLISSYKKVKDYKNLAIILEQLEYLKGIESNFIIKEVSELNRKDFNKRKIIDENKELNFLTQILTYVLSVLLITLICLVVFLSIQTYRLRHLKLGEH